MAEEAILRTQGLRLRGRGQAPIHLSVAPGQRIGILGAEGSGKTTLLRTLARLTPASGGRLYWGDVEVSRTPRWLLGRRRNYVKMLWADPYALFDERQHIRSLLRRTRSQQRGLRAHAQHYGLSPAVLSLTVEALSGLERVRLALSYVDRPPVLLVDDLFRRLIPESWADVRDLLNHGRAQHGAIIIASQFPEAVASVDHVYVMHDGDMVEWGRREAVLEHPQHPYTQWLTRRPVYAYERAEAEGWDVLPSTTRLPGPQEVGPGHWVRLG